MHPSNQTTNLPAGLSTTDAEAARETLATAVDKAGHLPGPFGSEVLYVARKAFVQEYHTAALVSAIVMAIIAVVIVTRLKGTKPASHEAPA